MISEIFLCRLLKKISGEKISFDYVYRNKIIKYFKESENL